MIWIDNPGLHRGRCVCSKTRFCFTKPLAPPAKDSLCSSFASGGLSRLRRSILALRARGLFLTGRVKPSLWQRLILIQNRIGPTKSPVPAGVWTRDLLHRKRELYQCATLLSLFQFDHYLFLKCRGIYKLAFKAAYGKSVFMSAPITVQVQPDPNKPVAVFVTFNKAKTYIAGEILPGRV